MPIVQARLAVDPGEACRGLGMMQTLGGADQSLGWHAADVHARAADRAMADQGHTSPLLGRGDRG
jgi:hypothetical protein